MKYHIKQQKTNERTSVRGFYDSEKSPKFAYNLALLGLSNSELATAFGVANQTLDSWFTKYPEFSYAIEKGREVADSKVVRALYKRACGYNYEDTHITVIKDKDGISPPVIISTPVVKHVPADIQAAIFWLTNRQRKYWSNTQKFDIDAKINHTVPDLSDLSNDELALLQKMGLKELMQNNVPEPSTN